jgi:hypothetical protein
LFRELVLVRAELHHVFENGRVGIQVIEPVLGEVAGHDIAAEFTNPALNGQHAGEDFQQGGFAGAVGPDEHDALSALGGEVEIPIHDVITVCLLHVFELDDLQARPRGLGEFEVDALQLFRRFLDGDGFESLDLFLLRFCA